MPKILDRLVSQLMEKGKSKDAATAIAVKALQKSGNLYPGTMQATSKGIARGNMTPSERAVDRQVNKTGKRATDYQYNYTTNRATLRKKYK